MNIFDINEEIRKLLESTDEDGCLSDEAMEQLSNLNAEKDAKFEAIALIYKETIAEADAIKQEAKKLADRSKAAEKKAERLKEYLAFNLMVDGVEKFTTPRVKVTFRASEQVVIDDERILSGDFFRIKTEIDKAGIKQALKEGVEVKGAHLESKQNIQIK